MKKYSFLISLFLIISTFLSVCAQDTEIITYTSGDWEYTENNNGITLTVYNGSDSALTIPEMLDEKPVTQLGKELFKNNRKLESVIIPDSVKAIGANAFNGCASLREVRLPDGLARIDGGTFRYCISLEDIDIPFSVTNVGANAFADCISLKEAMLISATNIGDSAFDNCQQLESVTLSRKLTVIGGFAFRDTPWLDAQTDDFVMIGKGLLIRYNGNDSEVQIPYGTTMITDAFADNYFVENVIVPETVIQIGANAFRDAVSLHNISLPPFLTTIAGNAFNGCRSLEAIELPSGVKSLGGSAFANCNTLERFVIPEAVTSLPGSLFANCPKLSEVIIPASVTKIDKNAFNGSPNVKPSVAYGSEAESLLTEYEIPYDYSVLQNEGLIYTQDAEGIHIIRYTGNLYDMEIPAQIGGAPVSSIEEGAFQNNSRVRRVILPLTVKTIGDWAFSYMPNLRTVQLSDGIEHLGANAFTGSENLQEIRLPKGIRTIGDNPFDPDTQTMICASLGTPAADQLAEMGFTVNSEDACRPNEEVIALREELAALEGDKNDSCDCNIPEKTESNAYEILRISDGISTLDAELLSGAAENLILVIPASVTQIDAGILENHTIQTIVSTTGTAAEQFAVEHGIRFLMQFSYFLNM